MIKIIRKINCIFRKPLVFEDITRTAPVSRVFGFDRGMPIDRYFIEKFLSNNSQYIRGSVLEIAESTYTKKYGNQVTSCEILHYDNSGKKATIIGDLTKEATLPEVIVDCFICTQTLNFIFDVRKAIEGSYKVLKEGGCFLCTISGISQISRYDMDRWGDYWRFTDLSIRRLMGTVFGEGNVDVVTFGNSLAATAFLKGLAVDDFPDTKVLDEHDRDYQVIIGVRAIKKKG
jgi:SAM-dependent methyltransferase